MSRESAKNPISMQDKEEVQACEDFMSIGEWGKAMFPTQTHPRVQAEAFSFIAGIFLLGFVLGGDIGNPRAPPAKHSPMSCLPGCSPQLPEFADCQGALPCEQRTWPGP